MVFFSSCMSVKFHHELLNYIDLPVMCIHVSTQLLIYMIIQMTLSCLVIYIAIFVTFMRHLLCTCLFV